MTVNPSLVFSLFLNVCETELLLARQRAQSGGEGSYGAEKGLIDETKERKIQKLRMILPVSGKGRRNTCVFLEGWGVFTEPPFRK